jgi:hypothetical protein
LHYPLPHQQEVPASEITAGTGASYRLFNVDNIKALGAWAGIQGKVTGALSIVTSSNLLPELKKAVSIYKGTDEVVAEV